MFLREDFAHGLNEFKKCRVDVSLEKLHDEDVDF